MKDNKKYLVYGMSESGKWTAKLLTQKKKKFYICDDDADVLLKFSSQYKIIYDKNMLKIIDVMIVSPAISVDNELYQYAKSLNIKIISELEFASYFTKNKIIAITGTNGKTTTTNIINKMLLTQYNSKAVGNLGYPLSRAVVERFSGKFVTEISSFMLENIDKIKFESMMITNIGSDHLDRHKSDNEYKNIKLNIFKNTKKKNFCVINLDDNAAAEIIEKCKCKKQFISLNDECVGCYVKDDAIYHKKNIKTAPIKIIDINNVALVGDFNLQNIIMSVVVAKHYKIKNQNIVKVIKELEQAKHRYQLVNIIDNVSYINDSKSTNIDSTLASCNVQNNDTILLLGGYEKELDYTNLFQKLPSHIIYCVCFGRIRDKMIAAAKKVNYKNIESVENLEMAVQLAKKIATPGMRVLLSPATSSFDQYASYAERGEHFINLVNL